MGTVDLLLQIQLTLYIVLASMTGALIGIDRSRREHHTAGLRTYMMVSVGSCLFTIISIHGFGEGDPSRVAAQVVSGIGFLGAGLIIEHKRRVHNLTSAATIWATAAIGMAIGAGAWLIAVISTLLVWSILDILRRFSKNAARRRINKNSKSSNAINNEQLENT